MLQRKILFATGFTAADREAFRQSCIFARAWKAELLILHVNRPAAQSSGEQSVAAKHGREDRLDLLSMELAKNNEYISHEHITIQGDPVDVILAVEKERDVDLIVLGTHGRKGVQRMFQGSVAETIIRSANCPVLTLRNSEPAQPVQPGESKPKILVPIDFSVYSYAALDFASSIAQAIDAGITILHVDDSHESNVKDAANGAPQMNDDRKKLWEQLKKFEPADKGVPFGHKLLNGPASKQIPHYARTNHYDYVVLGTHGRSGIGRALMGSVAERVVRNADCPVVTVKPSNKRNPVFR